MAKPQIEGDATGREPGTQKKTGETDAAAKAAADAAAEVAELSPEGIQKAMAALPFPIPTGAPGEPNKPSFAYDPKTLKPRLAPGETVLVEREQEGVKVYLTSAGRRIFACTFTVYETKFSPLLDRDVYGRYFPWAEDDPRRAERVAKAMERFRRSGVLMNAAVEKGDDQAV